MSETNLEKINAGALKKAEWIESCTELVGLIKAVEAVTTDAELSSAGKLQTKASKLIKALGKDRLDLTRQLDTVKREIMDQEREMTADIHAECDRIKRLNNNYATMQAMERAKERERIQEEERERMQKQAEAEKEAQVSQEAAQRLFGDKAVIMEEPVSVEPTPAPAPMPAEKAQASTVRQVVTWSHEVIDPALVPREFMTIDDKKIRAYRKAQVMLEKDPEIAGVRFSKSISVQSKG